MKQDFELGATIANRLGVSLKMHTFADAVNDFFDWDRFDYEDSNLDMIKAVLCVLKGYTMCGGEVDYSEATAELMKDEV